jgi:hypothetical protein
MEGTVASATTALFTAYVGIDWTDRKHDFCLQEGASTAVEFGVIEHQPEAIEKWAQGLHACFGGPIAICLETAQGPLVYALRRYEFLVLFPVHAATLVGYRKSFVSSGTKDDPSDAHAALDLLRRHPERLQPLRPQSPAMRMLASLVEERRQLINSVTRSTNRLVSTLKLYCPQALDWFEHRNTRMFCAFLDRWPTLAHVRRARVTTFPSFFHEHNCRRPHLVTARIENIRSARPMTADQAVIRPTQMVAETLVAQLRVLVKASERYDEEIDAISRTLPDYWLFASFPGAGQI